MSNGESSPVQAIIGMGFLVLIAVVILGGIFGAYPIWKVWAAEQHGKSLYAEAESTRQITILEANAKKEAAKSLADAEVTRAEGVAKANKIIGDSLKDNSEYLDYLWVTEVGTGNSKEVVYVPTEANLPILEATRGVSP